MRELKARRERRACRTVQRSARASLRVMCSFRCSLLACRHFQPAGSMRTEGISSKEPSSATKDVSNESMMSAAGSGTDSGEEKA